MTRIFRITKLTVLLCLLGGTAHADETERIKSAVVKGIALLQPCDEIFFNYTGCIACHQQSITAMAVEKAHSLGIQVDEKAAKAQRDLINLALKQVRAGRLQRVENPFVQPAVTGFYSLAFEAQGYEPNENTDAITIDMAGRQTPDGFWIAFTHRPPIEYSTNQIDGICYQNDARSTDLPAIANNFRNGSTKRGNGYSSPSREGTRKKSFACWDSPGPRPRKKTSKNNPTN